MRSTRVAFPVRDARSLEHLRDGHRRRAPPIVPLAPTAHRFVDLSALTMPSPGTIRRPLLLLCILSGLAAASSPAQVATGGPPAEVVRAQAALSAGHVDSAIATLEDFFRRTPNAVAGRLLLGNAYRQKGDLDKALAAYLAVTQPRPARLQAMFSAAGVHARKGNGDEAFALLGQLKASGAFDMDLLETSPDFGPLRGDPRLASVRFRPEDFQQPFVEPVKVIHEWIGEAKGDQFSWIARGIGDVDGDRASDVVTSAPTFGANGRPVGRGKVYVYSGRTGTLLWSQTGEEGENLGTGLEGAGDVDADGIGDVIAGAPGSGKAYVYSGRDGRRLHVFASGTPADRFGSSASGAGDQNGDGHADLLVGAPASNAAGQGAGRVYLFSGKDGSALLMRDGEQAGDAFGSIVAGMRSARNGPVLVGAPGAGAADRGRVYVYSDTTRTPRFVIEADSTGAALGAMFTSIVGDVDGDKVPDVYAADFANAASGPSTGRIYVHSGADGRRLHRFTGERAGDGFGIGSADVGDVNRDGFDDLLVGAWQYSAVASSGGKVYLYSGKDGALLRAITGRVPGETFGFDATGIGDVDGDGVIDLLITSTWSNVSGFRSGRMFILSGR